jgi:hypothetical protein
MESQQMMELLLAMREDMKANQEKADDNRKIDKDEMLKKVDDNQAKADADRKADRENLKGIIEEMKASQNDTLTRIERMMNTDQTDLKLKELTETVETTHRECEEPTSADMKVCHEAESVHTGCNFFKFLHGSS